MGRPNQCNPCCGNVQPPPPPPPEGGCRYFNPYRAACGPRNFIDDLVIKFVRINPALPVSFSWERYEYLNFEISDPENCIYCVSNEGIVYSTCTIPANPVIPFTACEGVYYNYCDNAEFVILRDVTMDVWDARNSFVITNADIEYIGYPYHDYCCGLYGLSCAWGWWATENYASCACIEMRVPPGECADIIYFDCTIGQEIGLSSCSLDEYSVYTTLCLSIDDWQAFINSLRFDGWNWCDFDNTDCYQNGVDIDFGDKLRIISGNPSFRFLGVCEWDEAAPECIKNCSNTCNTQ